MKDIYLMRHGETLFNKQKRVQGWTDSPLTNRGIMQAKSVGQYFRENEIQFQSAYSSTQERATDTLKLVTDAPYQQLKGLKEMNFGSFEAREEELLPKHRMGATSFEDLLVPYGGEDIREVGKRLRDTLIGIAERDSAEKLLIVSHGAAMWGFIEISNVILPQNVSLNNCAICHLQYVERQLHFVKWIDSSNGFTIHSF